MASVKYRFFASLLQHLEDIKETEKTKISIVYHTGKQTNCILRVCKGRDLSALCDVLCETRHPNIAVVYDYVYEDGDTYILEEHLNGRSVKDIMEEDGLISEKQTAKIVSDVCSALEVLHKKTPPVVHNDINPSNIMICDDGTVKLFDFDISRLYQKGKRQNTVLFGTEEYASPEHFGYGQSEPRTDIYCLGVTMHNMLTGNGLSDEHKTTYNGKLKHIINKCLEVDPDRRYSSVSELKKKLDQFQSKAQHIARKTKNVLFAAVIVVCCLLLFKVFGSEKIFNHSNDEKDTSPSTAEGASDTVNTTEPSDSAENQSTANQEATNNNTRETALPVALGQKTIGKLNTEEYVWYKISASGNNSNYRISISPTEVATNISFPCLYIGIYDAVGIKLDEFDVFPDKDLGFLDLNLQPNKEYFVKISLGGRFDYAGFELTVSEATCDAGSDKESATELAAGEQHTARLDSTLSDWYVFTAPRDGKYSYTVHNIDVGCDIYCIKHQPNGSTNSTLILNEDNNSGTVNATEGEFFYFEIQPYRENPDANGNYIIVITEENN